MKVKTGAAVEETVEVVDKPSDCTIMKYVKALVGVYKISLAPNPVSHVAGSVFISNNEVSWHSRFGHDAEKSITQTVPLAKEIEHRVSQLTEDCEVCLEAKSIQESWKPADKLIPAAR